MKTVSIIFLFSLFVQFAKAAPKVLTESVGQVGDKIITSREVQVASMLEQILEGSNTKPRMIATTDPKFSTEVSNLLIEQVVNLESESFNVGQATESDLKSSMEKIEKATRGNLDWDSLEVSESLLKKMLSQKISAKNFIKFKTDSMSSIITESEAKEYHNKNKNKFGELPFNSFRDNIKNFLAQKQLQERTKSWFEVLKRKYKVKNFLVEGHIK